MKFRELIRQVERDGWRHVGTKGSHMHYKHPTKPGKVTIPAGGRPGDEVPTGTERSIRQQAGLSDRS